MKNLSLIIIVMMVCSCNHSSQKTLSAQVKISKEQLMDKIKGGWAGQVIGCTYGGPTEFRYRETMIPDSISIPWTDGYIKWYFDNSPGLYDDVYMDLTFVNVFDKLGLDAPADSFAQAFADAPYPLWHANQSARYNILNGIMPPQSGHWLNNPHADDIDYQIEADFSGLMSPGMPNAASEFSDKIGHIMNYGDGWYGGVYVGAMYALAFVSDNVEWIVTEALKTIPEQSLFYQCANDVIQCHRQHPDDWKKAWLMCQQKWSTETGCPDGVFDPFDIDALINSAYIIIGLLYGEGDFHKTIDIATRCGQDSDCNPASAGGILGVIIGYNKIPEVWMKNLKEVEDINFAYTNLSLNKTYSLSFGQALQVIERNGGKIVGDEITIAVQAPLAVRYEKSFEGLYPLEKKDINTKISDVSEWSFEGTGIVVRGNINRCPDKDYVAQVEVSVDGQLIETVLLPANERVRRNELFWNYRLSKAAHNIKFKWINSREDANLYITDAIIYSDTPTDAHHQTTKH
jgi:hypothetical protein